MASARTGRTILLRGGALLSLALLSAGALAISPAAAGRSLSKKAALKLFYTKAQADAQFLTPQEGDAQFLTPQEGDSQFLTPQEGDSQFLTPQEGDARYLTSIAPTGLAGYCLSLAEPRAHGGCSELVSVADDPAWIVGNHVSMAIGTDGNPVISHQSQFNPTGELRVTKCNDPMCTGANETSTTVDSSVPAAFYNSIAINADGFPVISYFSEGANDLRLADCSNHACTASTLHTLDSPGNTGYENAIATGFDGRPVMSYINDDGDDLKLARCNGALPGSCSSITVTITTVDGVDASPAFDTSVAIGADGFPVISYGNSAGNLRVAKCNDVTCAGNNETLTTVDPGVQISNGQNMAVGLDGNPVIAYNADGSDDVKVAKCNDPACAGGNETLTTLDATGNTGYFPSIALGFGGNPIVNYTDSAGKLRVAFCNDPACAGGNETFISPDPPTDVVTSSVEVGLDGVPVIAYGDASVESKLRVVRVGF